MITAAIECSVGSLRRWPLFSPFGGRDAFAWATLEDLSAGPSPLEALPESRPLCVRRYTFSEARSRNG
jgi:hypothetical protein